MYLQVSLPCAGYCVARGLRNRPGADRHDRGRLRRQRLPGPPYPCCLSRQATWHLTRQRWRLSRQAAGETGRLAGQAAGETGRLAGQAAGETGRLAGQAAGQLSGEATGHAGHSARQAAGVAATGHAGHSAGEATG
ncbi:MAG TPA: hypothetical protein VE485_07285, partial [Mycobacterium sp.]|nr:hypothetical protein [Mycobacterium sp.]